MPIIFIISDIRSESRPTDYLHTELLGLTLDTRWLKVLTRAWWCVLTLLHFLSTFIIRLH